MKKQEPEAGAAFALGAAIAWEDAGKGIKRQIMGFDASLMVVKVNFEAGAVSETHAHPHAQSTYVLTGRFRVNVEGEEQVLSAGDGFFVSPGKLHGARCLEAGILLDAFSPCREDFLKEAKR
jgi:quercetin dioxygenase-like cupin family protein